MKKLALVSTIVSGLAFSCIASANPYGAWSQSDDDVIKISDSFNTELQSSVVEDNDISSVFSSTQDNDVTSSYRHSEDNDITSSYRHSEDNDVTSSWKYDSEVISPTLTSYKRQDQDAGHKSAMKVSGSATGHALAVRGGPVVVSVGREDTFNAGPVITNNNNFAPNTATIYGSSLAPIQQSGSFVGGDVKRYDLSGPIGNTSAVAAGNVGNQSLASLQQSGDSANGIDDDMISGINR